jgi:hypothetical protein
MIVLGICLLIIAAIVPKLAVLWGIGIIVLVVGVILLILGRIGRPVAGRRHYYWTIAAEANDARVEHPRRADELCDQVGCLLVEAVRSLCLGGLGCAVTGVTCRLFGAAADFGVRGVISGGE